MDNPEEIMHCLEEFSKLKPKDIPRELDEYLGYVAKTGDPVFKWSIIKGFLREKLLSVITDFYESTLTMELPPCPNVDPFNYERMKASLLEKLDSFYGAPFTIQRICELLTNPRKEYKRADKFMRAIEKNILVVSPYIRESGRQAELENDPQDTSFNGMPESNDSSIVSSTFPCNDIADATSNYEIVNSESHIHNSLKPNIMETISHTAMVQDDTIPKENNLIIEKTEEESEPCIVENNIVPDEACSVEKESESVICSTITVNAAGDVKAVLTASDSNIITQPIMTNVIEEGSTITSNDVEMTDQFTSSSVICESEVICEEYNVTSYCVTEIQSEVVTEIPSEPVTEIQSEVITEIQSEVVTEISSEAIPEIIPDVSSEVVCETIGEAVCELPCDPSPKNEADSFHETSKSTSAISDEVVVETKTDIATETNEPVRELEKCPIPENSCNSTAVLNCVTQPGTKECLSDSDSLPKVECEEKFELKDLVENNECQEPVIMAEQVVSDSTVEVPATSTPDVKSAALAPHTDHANSNAIECDTSNGFENKTFELETSSEAETKSNNSEMVVDSQGPGCTNNAKTSNNDVVPMVVAEDEVSESTSLVCNTDVKEDVVDSSDGTRETSVIHATSSEEKSDLIEVDSHSMEVDSQTPSNDQVD